MTNPTLATIAGRFSCRGYEDKKIEIEKLTAIARAGLQSPSAKNLQPWRIIIVKDKEVVDKIDAAATNRINANLPEGQEPRKNIFFNAPAVFLILKDTNAQSNWVDIDCGIVTQNIALAAHSMGVDNVIVAMASHAFLSDEAQALKKRLDWPEGFDFGMAVACGYGNTKKEPHEIDWGKMSFV